jgi:hypothetical protein
MKVKVRTLAFFIRSSTFRACTVVKPYTGAWERTRTNPNSVMAQVASSGNRCAFSHVATRS